MKTLFVARLHVWAHDSLRDTLVLFCASQNLDDLELSTELKADLEENLEPDDILVVVNEARFAEAYARLNSSTYVAQAIDRLRPGVRMSLVAFNGLGAEGRRCALANGQSESDIPLDDIVRPCLTHIFRLRNGFVEASPNYHFENPSGKHTTRFVRLSNLISHHPEISFLAFTVLPTIPADCQVVYTDTPSVFPIMALVNEHRRPTATLSDFVPTENFSSYSVLSAQAHLDPTQSIVLISASSSGGLAAEIHAKLGYPRTQIWHVLFAGPQENQHQVIGNLNYDQEKNPEGVRRTAPDYRAGSCAYCESGSFPIPLKGDQFELPGPQLDEVQLIISDEPRKLRTLIGRYAGKGVFGVGMGARQSGFARQFNVNIPGMLGVAEFQRDFRYILRRTLPFSCEHVVYLDKPSLPLAEEAQSALREGIDRDVALLNRGQLSSIPSGLTSPVTVIGAAVESGRSLLDLSRDLRTICVNSPITYIISISKSNGYPRREDLIANLSMTDHPAKHEVVTFETIMLPSSSEGHSWHRERKLLARIKSFDDLEDSLSKFVEDRLQTLSDDTTVLYNDLFWTNQDDSPLQVQPGFVFANRKSVDNYQQADVYFTICSILQRLRANSFVAKSERAIISNWFQQTLLSPENFGRFNDGVIQASLLRAASPRELNYSGKEELSREAGRIISRIVASAAETRGEAAAEFLLAIATDTLILRQDDLNLVMQAVPTGLARLDLLRKAIQTQTSC